MVLARLGRWQDGQNDLVARQIVAEREENGLSPYMERSVTSPEILSVHRKGSVCGFHEFGGKLEVWIGVSARL